jgi:hypothetical protein
VGALALVILAGCGAEEGPRASRAYCEAAVRYEKELERQGTSGDIDTERQIARVEDLVEHAPREIRAEAQAFLDALRAVEDDPTIRGSAEVEETVDDVNRFTSQACGFFDRR